MWNLKQKQKQNKKNPKLIDAENRFLVVRGSGWEMGEMGEGGQKVETSSYK